MNNIKQVRRNPGWRFTQDSRDPSDRPWISTVNKSAPFCMQKCNVVHRTVKYEEGEKLFVNFVVKIFPKPRYKSAVTFWVRTATTAVASPVGFTIFSRGQKKVWEPPELTFEAGAATAELNPTQPSFTGILTVPPKLHIFQKVIYCYWYNEMRSVNSPPLPIAQPKHSLSPYDSQRAYRTYNDKNNQRSTSSSLTSKCTIHAACCHITKQHITT
jgi:hypothetical protein